MEFLLYSIKPLPEPISIYNEGCSVSFAGKTSQQVFINVIWYICSPRSQWFYYWHWLMGTSKGQTICRICTPINTLTLHSALSILCGWLTIHYNHVDIYQCRYLMKRSYECRQQVFHLKSPLLLYDLMDISLCTGFMALSGQPYWTNIDIQSTVFCGTRLRKIFTTSAYYFI